MRNIVGRATLGLVLALPVSACAPERCGPRRGEVVRVLDGDTVVLRSGEIVRYLLIDSPETGDPPECFGLEAREANRALVAGKEVQLRYDAECEDRYGRLLAHVEVAGREVNRTLVERGFACLSRFPLSDAADSEEIEELEAQAREARRGLWGACAREHPC